MLLLPWAALPWLVGLTARATRDRGWRWPAVLALVVFAAGGVNASSLVLVAIGPLLWLVREAVRRRSAGAGGAGRRRPDRAAAPAACRCGGWSGVRLQGAYGLPVLQLTENLRDGRRGVVPGRRAARAGQLVLLRPGPHGLLARPGRGLRVERARGRHHLRGAGRSRWRPSSCSGGRTGATSRCSSSSARSWRSARGPSTIRARTAACGAPSPRTRRSGWRCGTRPGPCPWSRWGWPACWRRRSPASAPTGGGRAPPSGSPALGLATLLPVWQDGYLTEGMARARGDPRLLARGGARPRRRRRRAPASSRCPGSTFAAYGWGTTVDPITPALIDAPVPGEGGAARRHPAVGEPAGRPRPADAARDLRAAGAGAGGPPPRGGDRVPARRPRPDRALRRPGRSRTCGRRSPDPTPAGSPTRWASVRRVAAGRMPSLPSVALFDVEDPVPIVRTAPVDRPVVLAGRRRRASSTRPRRGCSTVGRSCSTAPPSTTARWTPPSRREPTSSSPTRTAGGSRRGSTPSRTRAVRPSSEGETQPDPTGYDFRLDPFPGSTDASRTVAVQVGGEVEATMAGGPERPEERAVHAADGDPATSWRVGGDDPRGQSITLTPDEPVEADEVRLVQAATANGRRIAASRSGCRARRPCVADLGPASLRAGRAGRPAARRRRVEPHGRDPRDVAAGPDHRRRHARRASPRSAWRTWWSRRRSGSRSTCSTASVTACATTRLDIVLTRLLAGTEREGRPDEEPRLDRTFELPVERTFALVGERRRATTGGGRPHGVPGRRAGGGRGAAAGPRRRHAERRALRGLRARGAGPGHPPPPDAVGDGHDDLALRPRRAVVEPRTGEPARRRAPGRIHGRRPRRSPCAATSPGSVEVEVDPTGRAVLAGARAERQRGWDVVGRRWVGRRSAAGQRLRQRVGHHPRRTVPRSSSRPVGRPQRLVPLGLAVSAGVVAGVPGDRVAVPASADRVARGGARRSPWASVRPAVPLAATVGTVIGVTALALLVASPSVALVAGGRDAGAGAVAACAAGGRSCCRRWRWR